MVGYWVTLCSLIPKLIVAGKTFHVQWQIWMDIWRHGKISMQSLSTRLLTSCCGILRLFTQHCVWTERRVNVPLLQISKDITVGDECFSPLALRGTNVAVQCDKEGWNCSTLCGHLIENLFHAHAHDVFTLTYCLFPLSGIALFISFIINLFVICVFGAVSTKSTI